MEIKEIIKLLKDFEVLRNAKNKVETQQLKESITLTLEGTLEDLRNAVNELGV